MEKKNLDRKSKTRCTKCNQEVINHAGRYCRCIESQLPKMGKSSVRAFSAGDQIEKFTACIEAYQATREMPKLEVVERLKEFGLVDFEIELIFDRFYDELTFTKIVKKRGWTSAGSASHAFKQVLRKLRKSGFSFK